jgi:hypothetical protein
MLRALVREQGPAGRSSLPLEIIRIIKLNNICKITGLCIAEGKDKIIGVSNPLAPLKRIFTSTTQYLSLIREKILLPSNENKHEHDNDDDRKQEDDNNRHICQQCAKGVE